MRASRMLSCVQRFRPQRERVSALAVPSEVLADLERIRLAAGLSVGRRVATARHTATFPTGGEHRMETAVSSMLT